MVTRKQLITATSEDLQIWELKNAVGAGLPLVVQWLRMCLGVQGTLVRSLGTLIPHAEGLLSPSTTTTEVHALAPMVCNETSEPSEKAMAVTGEYPTPALPTMVSKAISGINLCLL